VNVERLALAKSSVKATPKRRYDTRGRRASARETRRRILAAARRLFLERGYAQTTMATIADAAEVSIETIYLSIGGKASLVRYLVETALSGTDKPVPPFQRKGVKEIHAEPDPRRKLQLLARMVRPMLERLAPIWQVVMEVAPIDAELSSLVAELKQRHAGSMRLVIDHLSEAGRLRPSISKDIARDVLWAMNSSEFYGLLVVGRGWTGEAFENWLADAWQRLLLDGDPAPTKQMRK
jgi:AcrR family transcriptional regulator